MFSGDLLVVLCALNIMLHLSYARVLEKRATSSMQLTIVIHLPGICWGSLSSHPHYHTVSPYNSLLLQDYTTTSQC